MKPGDVVYILRWRVLKPLLDRGVVESGGAGGVMLVCLGQSSVFVRTENIFTDLRDAQAAYFVAERAYALSALAGDTRPELHDMLVR